jgi:MFS family permease
MFAPGIPQVLEEFGSTSNTLATFLVSIFVLGFAFGPLLMAPMSEIYGRLPVYNICNVLFLIFTILSAVATNMGMLLAVRFLAGVAGVAVITCGGGSISDMMPPEKRGRAMAIWSVGPILGPMIGPGTFPRPFQSNRC